MCVIAVSNQKLIPLKTLEACEAYNSHGGGCAWIQDGQVHYHKGIKAKRIFDILQDAPLPHVVHFRWKTVGGITDELCHPFVVRTAVPKFTKGKTSCEVLFHNGTIDDIELYAHLAGAKVYKNWTDSKAIAKVVSLRGHRILKEVSAATARRQFPNKFAVMNRRGEVRIYGEFHERNGVLFSNLRWQHGVRSRTKLTAKSGYDASGVSIARYQSHWWEDGGMNDPRN